MGQCGCGDYNASMRFPGPPGITYAIQFYAGCGDCDTPAGIIIADAPDGRIRLVNSAALGIRGGRRESLVDIPMEDHPLHWKTYYPDGRLYEPEKLPLSRAILTGERTALNLLARLSGIATMTGRFVDGAVPPVDEDAQEKPDGGHDPGERAELEEFDGEHEHDGDA